jgi:hypothetical protein
MHADQYHTTPELPAAVEAALQAYLGQIDRTLPSFLEGFYLHGSLALGAWEAGLSDVDFIAVAGRRCSTSDLEALGDLHADLARRYPAVQLEGGYLAWEDLGRSTVDMPPHPQIHDGVLHASGYHDINHVTWWILKQRDIVVRGPAPGTLAFEVDWDALVDAMHRNMNSYWRSFTTDARRIAWLLSDYGVQWAVLGVLRQMYTFREGEITSKAGAGRYGLRQLPERWHALIREAIAIREAGYRSSRRARPARALQAHAFLCAVIAACDTGNRRP